MKLNINDNDLLILKNEECKDYIANIYDGFCIFLHPICIKDARILFKPTSYNSNIFNL